MHFNNYEYKINKYYVILINNFLRQEYRSSNYKYPI